MFVAFVSFSLFCILCVFQTRDTQTAADRKKVTDLMCHSTLVSDQFYAYNPEEDEAAEVRRIIRASMEGPDVRPKKATAKKKRAAEDEELTSGSTTEEEEKVS